MKKTLTFTLIIIFLIINLILVVTMILVGLFVSGSNYLYPFNTFEKVEDTLSLSKNQKNVIYIMLDMTTGLDVTSILQSTPEFAENFTGFTNYLNVVTTNWGTNASVPNIFGGYDFNPYYKNYGPMKDIDFKEYMTRAMNILFSAFGAKEWAISAVGNQYYNYNGRRSYWDSNWETLEKDFAQYHVQAINSNDISRLIYYQNPELYQQLKLPENIFLKSSNANFIPMTTYLSQAKIEETQTNKFIMMMDESNHSPTVMDEAGNYESSPVTIKNIYRSTTGFVRKINNFISYLKTNGIYDNTMIVINSDHGNNGTGSLPVADPSYNHTGIDYQAIATIQKQYPKFTRGFPILLVKPFNETSPIKYDNGNLYTNTDALTFIKEYNPDVEFSLLNQTADPRYLKKLSDAAARSEVYMPSYNNDSLWNDNFIHYLTPDSGFGGYSFLVKKSIYDLQNYLVARDLKDYYAPDDLAHWKSIVP